MSRIERSVSGSRAWVAAEVERWAEKERSRKDPEAQAASILPRSWKAQCGLSADRDHARVLNSATSQQLDRRHGSAGGRDLSPGPLQLPSYLDSLLLLCSLLMLRARGAAPGGQELVHPSQLGHSALLSNINTSQNHETGQGHSVTLAGGRRKQDHSVIISEQRQRCKQAMSRTTEVARRGSPAGRCELLPLLYQSQL